MKLLTRTNLYFALIALVVFAIGGAVFGYELRRATKSDAEEKLNVERDKLIQYVRAHKNIPQNFIYLGDTVCFTKFSQPWSLNGALQKSFNVSADNGRIETYKLETPGCTVCESQQLLKDTALYTAAEKDYEPYRMLEFGLNEDTLHYKVVILKPLIESDELTEAVVGTIVIIAVVLLLALLLLNTLISKTVWSPFYKMLYKLEAFDLTKEGSVEFGTTSIKEFRELRNVLVLMTRKISSDYRSLKEFTENASHELQTPLSIIQSKVELLIQSENLSAMQMAEVQAVYEATGRLSRLNKALLLLAKIENRQFAETKEISLDELIEKKLENFSDMIAHKHLNVVKELEPVKINIHPSLADILLSNLIGNAIKHNIEGGTLKIELTTNKLTISNSGKPLSMPPEELFQRFRKADGASESLGLGLAIVKEICNVNGYSINYFYVNNLHIISVAL
jgi:signal transduction histidine kinase